MRYAFFIKFLLDIILNQLSDFLIYIFLVVLFFLITYNRHQSLKPPP